MAIIEKRDLNIVALQPVEQGVSAASGKTWARQTIVLKELFQNSAPVLLAATLLGTNIDKVKNYRIDVSDTVDVTLAVSSREYNGKWYTECVVREIKCFYKEHSRPNMAMEKEKAEVAAQMERYNATTGADDDYLYQKLQEKFGKVATDMSPKGEQSDDLPF